MYDIGTYYEFDNWHIEAEYLYKTYAKNSFDDVHAFNAFVNYDLFIKKGLFRKISFLGRYDSMGDHSNGNADEDGKLYITDYSRQRVTGGVTLSFGKAFQADLRLNYEKYFYDKLSLAKESEQDKFVMELMVRILKKAGDTPCFLLFVLLVFSFSIPAFIPELTGISVIFLRVTGFSSTGSAPSSAKGASLSPPLFHHIFQFQQLIPVLCSFYKFQLLGSFLHQFPGTFYRFLHLWLGHILNNRVGSRCIGRWLDVCLGTLSGSGNFVAVVAQQGSIPRTLYLFGGDSMLFVICQLFFTTAVGFVYRFFSCCPSCGLHT